MASSQTLLAGLNALFGFGLYKSHLHRLATTITSLSDLILYLLPLLKGAKVHPFKLAAVEEQFRAFLCLDKPEATVCD
jgi:hypothetical protein